MSLEGSRSGRPRDLVTILILILAPPVRLARRTAAWEGLGAARP
jgi:hypothetical protein